MGAKRKRAATPAADASNKKQTKSDPAAVPPTAETLSSTAARTAGSASRSALGSSHAERVFDALALVIAGASYDVLSLITGYDNETVFYYIASDGTVTVWDIARPNEPATIRFPEAPKQERRVSFVLPGPAVTSGCSSGSRVLLFGYSDSDQAGTSIPYRLYRESTGTEGSAFGFELVSEPIRPCVPMRRKEETATAACRIGPSRMMIGSCFDFNSLSADLRIIDYARDGDVACADAITVRTPDISEYRVSTSEAVRVWYHLGLPTTKKLHSTGLVTRKELKSQLERVTRIMTTEYPQFLGFGGDLPLRPGAWHPPDHAPPALYRPEPTPLKESALHAGKVQPYTLNLVPVPDTWGRITHLLPFPPPFHDRYVLFVLSGERFASSVGQTTIRVFDVINRKDMNCRVECRRIRALQWVDWSKLTEAADFTPPAVSAPPHPFPYSVLIVADGASLGSISAAKAGSEFSAPFTIAEWCLSLPATVQLHHPFGVTHITTVSATHDMSGRVYTVETVDMRPASTVECVRPRLHTATGVLAFRRDETNPYRSGDGAGITDLACVDDDRLGVLTSDDRLHVWDLNPAAVNPKTGFCPSIELALPLSTSKSTRPSPIIGSF